VRAYLGDFPARAATPTAQMQGTRVTSNPPGATLIAAVTLGLLDRSPSLRQAMYRLGSNQELPARYAHMVSGSTFFGLALLLLWLLAAPFLYWSAGAFLPPSTAAVFAAVCLFTPATVLFAPGKDSAQLLTVALPLWLWLLAWRSARRWVAPLAGAAFVVSSLVSLVHVWIAALLFAATVLASRPGQRWRVFVHLGLPAIGGALVVAAGLFLFARLNLFAGAWAVARAQAEVTRGPGAMPLIWQVLGVPLFLLFAGPALWFIGLAVPRKRAPDDVARFGLFLLVGTLLVMLATVGFTNVEAPRLWIPFTPLLLLGGGLQLPVFRTPGRRAAGLLAALVFLQFAASAAHWSLMDARETETRLIDRPDGGARFFD
jgi:hypothetical protein